MAYCGVAAPGVAMFNSERKKSINSEIALS